MKEETKQYIRQIYEWLGYASTIGLSLAFAVVIGALFGFYLDKWVFGKPKIFFYIFLIMGVIAGFRNIYILGKRLQKKM